MKVFLISAGCKDTCQRSQPCTVTSLSCIAMWSRGRPRPPPPKPRVPHPTRVTATAISRLREEPPEVALGVMGESRWPGAHGTGSQLPTSLLLCCLSAALLPTCSVEAKGSETHSWLRRPQSVQ